MISTRQIISVIIVVTIILGSVQSSGVFTPTSSELIDNVNTSGIMIQSLLSDPFFTQSPDVVINGTSDEFSSSHHAGSGGSEVSYLELNWTHTPGTKLEYIGDGPDDIMPDPNR